jgi:epoxyqueuosine reductase
MDDEAFPATFRRSPIKRAKRRGLARNAAVVLGNIGDERDLPALARASHDHEPLVEQHVAWAREQIDARRSPAE